jgi:DNA gyrase/topoisomerase IV subunit A
MLRVTSDLYSEYLKYTNRFRHIPFYIDCLKIVERRLLLTLNEEAPSNKKYVKSAKITGYCSGNLHPHGSAYDALVGLVHRGFVEGSGNWGNFGFNEDDPAGAERYTECRSDKKIESVISEFLEYVPKDEIEYAQNEPLYFSNPIPIGLVGIDFITGIGVDVVRCPRYNGKDLYDRLFGILSGEPLKPIIPNIPGCNVTEESPGEFEKILTTGKGVIKITPHIKIFNNRIDIIGRSPLIGFTRLISFNNNYFIKNKVLYFEHIDLCGNKNPIEVQIFPAKGGALTTEFINTILSKISQKVNVICNFIDKDFKTRIFGIDELLLSAFNNWKGLFLTKLNDDKSKMEEKLFELKVIQIVRDIIRSTDKYKNVDDIIDIFTPHKEHFPGIEEKDLRRVISKYTIKYLIEKDLNVIEYQKELDSINENIKNIDIIALEKLKGYYGQS